MNDRNLRESQRVRSYAPRRREFAVSAIVGVIASAMVLSAGMSAYADDAKIVKDLENAQTQVITEPLDGESGQDGQSAASDSHAPAADEEAAVEEDDTSPPPDEAQPVPVADTTDYAKYSWHYATATTWDALTGGPVVITNTENNKALTCEKNDQGLKAQDIAKPADASHKWEFTIDAAGQLFLQCKATGEYLAETNGKLGLTSHKMTVNSWEDTYIALQGGGYLRYNAEKNSFINGDWGKIHVYMGQPKSGGGLENRDFTEKTDGIVNPKNTMVNLFDYWTTGDEISHRNDKTPGWGFVNGDPNNHSNGVNKNNALKFVSLSNGNNRYGNMNVYTESNAVRQGIVKPALGSDGYPQLSGSSELKGPNSTDVKDAALSASLAYLFNSADADGEKGASSYQAGKKAFMNTQGLLSEDAEGYTYYNSAENYTYFDEKKNKFTLYNSYVACNAGEMVTVGDTTSHGGQFFPFNTLKSAQDLEGQYRAGKNPDGCQSPDINHFFGLNLVSSFTQRYGGHVSNQGRPVTFEFSGDDDVWIFIDGVLVADLGGIHQASGVTIDFSTGNIKITRAFNSAGQPEVQSSTLKSHFPGSQQQDASLWNGNTFADNTEHTFSFFYLERGSGQSNLKIKYNFRDIPAYSLNKVDQYNQPVAGARFAAYRGKEVVTGGTDAGSQNRTEYITQYATAESGYTEYKALPADATVDKNTGVIMVDGQIWAEPILVSDTDKGGVMDFKNEHGDFYKVDEFIEKNNNSQTFVMREIQVPEGYRTVSDDFVLTFAGTPKQDAQGKTSYRNLVLTSANPYLTGVWASPIANVSSDDELYPVVNESDKSVTDTTVQQYIKDGKIAYYNKTTGKSEGTLFAVVQHRHFDKSWTSLKDVGGWKALSGTAGLGYTESDDTDKASSIDAAKRQAELSANSNVFRASGTTMKATMDHLPGDPTEYYSFVEREYFDGDSGKIQWLLENCPATGNTQKNRFINCKAEGYSETALAALDNVRYVVTYYWTNGTLENATTGNTVRVHSHSVLNTDSTDGFSVDWGSNVRVPNVENRLIFRNMTYDKIPTKRDGQDAATAYNGSFFALYEVGEIAGAGDQSTLYYVANNNDAARTRIVLADNTAPDGTITDSAWIVNDQGHQVGAAGTYTVNQESGSTAQGDITVSIGEATYTIPVVKNAGGERCVKETLPETGSERYIAEDGTNYFGKIREGDYVLRQITAPVRAVGEAGVPASNTEDGMYRYAINIAQTLVRVDSTGLYANAGGNSDGVIVGNGAGYVVKTMNWAASRGVLDETLTWIATFLRVNTSKNFSSFEAFYNGTETSGVAPWGQSTKPFKDVQPGIAQGTTGKFNEAMTSYLIYDPKYDATQSRALRDTEHALFDYVANDNQKGESRTDYQFCTGDNQVNGSADANAGCSTMGDGEALLRLYTDEGWSRFNIYQDYSFGAAQTAGNANVEYTSLLKREVTNLFSNSTFVTVYNAPEGQAEEEPGFQLPSTGDTGMAWWLFIIAAAGVVAGLIIRNHMRKQMNGLAGMTGRI